MSVTVIDEGDLPKLGLEEKIFKKEIVRTRKAEAYVPRIRKNTVHLGRYHRYTDSMFAKE